MAEYDVNDTDGPVFQTVVRRKNRWSFYDPDGSADPDSFLELWDICHDPRTNSFVTQDGILQMETDLPNERVTFVNGKHARLTVAQYLARRFRILVSALRGKCRGEFFQENDIHEQLLKMLMKWSRKEMEKNCRYLPTLIRKEIAKENDSSGYDLERKLRDALHVLVTEKKAQTKDARTDAGRNGKTDFMISEYSLFKHADAPDRAGSYSNYLQRKKEVPFFKPRRDADVSTIKEADAKRLMEQLLLIFNGWTQFWQLKETAQKHIPPIGSTVFFDDVGRNDESIPDKPQEEIFADEWVSQAREKEALDQKTIAARSDEIWDKICKTTTDEFFCLYILPEDYLGPMEQKYDDRKRKGSRYTLARFGDPQRMSETKDKVHAVIEKSTAIMMGKNKDLPRALIGEIVSRVFGLLACRCKENNHDPTPV